MYLDYQTIGKRIRLLRKQQHLSQIPIICVPKVRARIKM